MKGLPAIALVVACLLPSLARADETRACASAAERGQLLMQNGELRAAHEALLVCTREACPGMIRKDCVQWLSKVEDDLPSFVVDAHDADGQDVVGVRVLIDGRVATPAFDGKAITVDPGLRVFRFEAEGREPLEQKLMIRQGEKNRRVTVTFGGAGAQPPLAQVQPVPPKPAPHEQRSGPPALAYAFGGAAVVALGVFSYFAIDGINDRGKLIDECKPACSQASIDHVHDKFVVADVALGVSVLAVGLATYFFLAPRDKTTARLARTLVLTF